MNKLITRLAVSITLAGGMLLPATLATAQQQVVAASDLQFVESSILGEPSQLRAGRADDLINLKTSQYVAKDINGKEYDIDAILKSGKAIMIDFSTVWCGWCWKLHQSGVLEKLYAKFGPEGTDQIEVFWVEAEGASKSAIQAKSKDWSKDSKGNPVPYPLFSDSRMHPTLGIDVPGFPTLVLVGKNKKWIECKQEVATSDPNFKRFAELLDLFMTDEDKPQSINISGATDLYLGETHTLKVNYATVAPATKVEWKAPQEVTLKKVSDTESQITADKLGSYEIEVTVTNKNGSATGKVTVTISAPIASYPFFCGMDNKEKMDKGWRSIDHDGDGLGFLSFSGEGLLDRLGLQLKEGFKAGAEKSDDCLISFGTFYPTQFVGRNFKGVTIESDNELLSAPLVIPADADKPTFSCYFMRYFGAERADELKVMVSEPNGTPVELLAPQKPTSSWTLISVDLSAYKGKTILLSLVPVVNGSSAILVDQLRVTMDGSTDVEAPTLNVQTSLYPNPASDYVTVKTRVGSSIELFAADGALLSTTQAMGEETTIALAQLPAGRYLVRITSLEGEIVLRPLIIQ
ncbi:T9SS type A sorting domain-containing protein [Porphyromonas sp.]|uniref:T9SS type A sorting domain-containing protein n=1 Tax=Porphyromonas sp. TaxID=1924944 RepID=UPI003AAF5D5C